MGVVDTGRTMGKMSTMQTEQRDITTMTLDELGVTARLEYEHTAKHLASALHHAIRSGEALLRARQLVPKADWEPWVRERVGITDAWASQLMRLAHYRDEIPNEILEGGSISEARQHITGLPAIQPPGPAPRIPAGLVDEAKRLRSEGMSYAEVGRSLDVNQSEVWRWLNPDKHRKITKASSLKHQRAKRALKREQDRQDRDRLAKATGGELAKSYSLIRQALAVLDKVATEPAGEAIRHLHRAEEAVVQAMRQQEDVA